MSPCDGQKRGPSLDQETKALSCQWRQIQSNPVAKGGGDRTKFTDWTVRPRQTWKDFFFLFFRWFPLWCSLCCSSRCVGNAAGNTRSDAAWQLGDQVDPGWSEFLHPRKTQSAVGNNLLACLLDASLPSSMDRVKKTRDGGSSHRAVRQHIQIHTPRHFAGQQTTQRHRADEPGASFMLTGGQEKRNSL